jgi:hypothetical protein
MLRVVERYCKLWRFEFNLVKNELVVYGTREKDFQFFLGGNLIQMVDYCKYLGMEIGQKNSVRKWKVRVIKKVRRSIF